MSRLRSDETGIALIEVLIAMIVLVIGIVVFVSVIPSATRVTQTATRSEQASAAAEKEIERIRSLPYNSVGLSSLPAAEAGAAGSTSNPFSPTYWLRNGNSNYLIANNWADKGSGTMAGTPAGGEPLWTTGGTLAPQGTVKVDGQTADVFRYVTARDEACPPNAGPLLNPLITLITPPLGVILSNFNAQIQTILNNRIQTGLNLFCLGSTTDTKRVIVAVRMRAVGNAAGSVLPVYLSTVLTDKTRGIVSAP